MALLLDNVSVSYNCICIYTRTKRPLMVFLFFDSDDSSTNFISIEISPVIKSHLS